MILVMPGTIWTTAIVKIVVMCQAMSRNPARVVETVLFPMVRVHGYQILERSLVTVITKPVPADLVVFHPALGAIHGVLALDVI